MTEKERVKMKDFLENLSSDDVFSIARTSTGGLISPTSHSDAISIILKYSDPVTLLNRRKIKKESIANYLHSQSVNFQIPTSKMTLINIMLRHWGIIQPCSTTVTSLNYQRVEDDESRRTQCDPGSCGDRTYSTQPVSALTAVTTSPQNNGHLLAEEFAKWFYPIWNSLLEFGPNHFWAESNLRVEVIEVSVTGEEERAVKEIYQNGPECAEFMAKLIREDKLYLNPNVRDGGVWGTQTPHGLAQVIVCGTVLKDERPFGIFEQVFGLVQDPRANSNYKIQFSVIRFKGRMGLLQSECPPMPTIKDSSLYCMIEEVSDPSD